MVSDCREVERAVGGRPEGVDRREIVSKCVERIAGGSDDDDILATRV